jgi:hypothetical protein
MTKSMALLRITLAYPSHIPRRAAAHRWAEPAGATRTLYFFFAAFDLPACFGFDALLFALPGFFDFFAFGAADFTGAGAAGAAAVGGAGFRA